MSDFAFKPAGAAFAALIAGIAPAAEAPEAPTPDPAADAADALAVDYASLPAAEPLGGGDIFTDLDAATADVPLAPGAQLRLPLV